jgi:hypothetical protein
MPIAAISLQLLIFPKSSRCTVDMLIQNLQDKTVDYGKLYNFMFVLIAFLGGVQWLIKNKII